MGCSEDGEGVFIGQRDKTHRAIVGMAGCMIGFYLGHNGTIHCWTADVPRILEP